MNINRIFMLVHVVIMFFGLHTFYRLFTKKNSNDFKNLLDDFKNLFNIDMCKHMTSTTIFS